MGLLLAVHAVATLSMTGLIWFVQVVHYPLMARVGAKQFPAYEAMHTARTTWVVAPLMLVELASAVALAVIRPDGVGSWQPIAALALLAGIWASTAWLQVPQHRRLADGFDRDAHAKLVGTNWLRTVGWSLRALLVTSWLG